MNDQGKKISNFGKLTSGLKRQQHEQRLGAASMQPIDIGSGTRSGAAFLASEEQLTRLQLHRKNNPELKKLRGRLDDFTRGKLNYQK
jgi:hypothetical protein